MTRPDRSNEMLRRHLDVMLGGDLWSVPHSRSHDTDGKVLHQFRPGPHELPDESWLKPHGVGTIARPWALYDQGYFPCRV